MAILRPSVLIRKGPGAILALNEFVEEVVIAIRAGAVPLSSEPIETKGPAVGVEPGWTRFEMALLTGEDAEELRKRRRR